MATGRSNCALTGSVRASVRSACALVGDVTASRSLAYTIPQDAVDAGLGVDAPSEDWAIAWASTTAGDIQIEGQLILFTPVPGSSGPVQITYQLINGLATIDGTIAVTVEAPQQIQAVTDRAFVLQDASGQVIAVRLNDIGEGLVIDSASADIGVVAIVPEGVAYTPPVGYIGPAVITYTVSQT